MSYVVVDVETTGLYPHEGHEIIEIGAIKIENNNVTDDVFETYVKPTRPVPTEIHRISGITQEHVKDAPPIQHVMPRFLSFIGSKTLVAQNAKFDLGFIQASLKRAGCSPLSNNFLDTMLMSKKLFFYENEHNLDAILRRLQIEHDITRHRSIGDCKLTGLAFLKMIEILKKKNKNSLKNLSDFAVKPSAKVKIKETAKNLSLF